MDKEKEEEEEEGEEGYGDVDGGKKRNGEEEESIKLFQKIKRDRFESLKLSLDIDFNFDPPWVTEFLEFTVSYQEKMIQKLTTEIMAGASKGQWEETENYIKELGDTIKLDPRLGNLLKDNFLEFLVALLGHGKNPKIQSYASIVLQPVIAYSKNKGAVVKYLTASTVVNLLRSLDSEVQVEAIWLLRTIALAYSDCDEHKNILEGSLDTLIPLLVDSTIDEEMLSGGIDALAAICQVHPKLSLEKLKWTVSALVKLIKSESLNVVASACTGLAFLCEGKEKMVVDNQDIRTLIDHLIVLIDSDSRLKIRAGLAALGSIVRWGSDDDIEIIIEKEALWSLECLLREEDKYMVKDACWIISNIATGKESHVTELIDCECITSLVRVVENYELLDVKIEAAWAISNAIFGVSSYRKEELKNKCGNPVWNLMRKFTDNQQTVFLCLEGLVGLGVLTVTCNGQKINAADWLTNFKKLLLRIEEGVQFQLADNIGGLTKSKKLQAVDNIEKTAGDIVFNLTCTFEDLHQSDSQKLVLHVYSSFGEDMRYAWMV